MRNNIDSKDVLNRKIVIELRFNSDPTFLDMKGRLVSEIAALESYFTEWKIGETIELTDHKEPNEVRHIVRMSIDRLSFISSSITSIDDYFNKFEKIYKLINKYFTDLTILRIGCRIQGTYKTSSSDFNTILENFSNTLPKNIFIDGFPINDLRFKLDYQNGTYNIGPIQENDIFVRTNFSYKDRVEGAGIGIDTDNFLLKNSSVDLNNISKIKDVFVASLSVEKTLLSNLKEF